MDNLYTNVLSKRAWPPPTPQPCAVPGVRQYRCGPASVFVLEGAVWKRAQLHDLLEHSAPGCGHAVVLGERFSFRETAFQVQHAFVEVFTNAFCAFDRTMCAHFSLYEKCPEEEVLAFEERHRVRRQDLPLLRPTDPAARIYGFRPGDTVFLPAHQELRFVAVD